MCSSAAFIFDMWYDSCILRCWYRTLYLLLITRKQNIWTLHNHSHWIIRTMNIWTHVQYAGSIQPLSEELSGRILCPKNCQLVSLGWTCLFSQWLFPSVFHRSLVLAIREIRFFPRADSAENSVAVHPQPGKFILRWCHMVARKWAIVSGILHPIVLNLGRANLQWTLCYYVV